MHCRYMPQGSRRRRCTATARQTRSGYAKHQLFFRYPCPHLDSTSCCCHATCCMKRRECVSLIADSTVARLPSKPPPPPAMHAGCCASLSKGVTGPQPTSTPCEWPLTHTLVGSQPQYHSFCRLHSWLAGQVAHAWSTQVLPTLRQPSPMPPHISRGPTAGRGPGGGWGCALSSSGWEAVQGGGLKGVSARVMSSELTPAA